MKSIIQDLSVVAESSTLGGKAARQTTSYARVDLLDPGSRDGEAYVLKLNPQAHVEYLLRHVGGKVAVLREGSSGSSWRM